MSHARPKNLYACSYTEIFQIFDSKATIYVMNLLLSSNKLVHAQNLQRGTIIHCHCTPCDEIRAMPSIFRANRPVA